MPDYCPQCGAPLRDGDKFCMTCGCKIESKTTPEAAKTFTPGSGTTPQFKAGETNMNNDYNNNQQNGDNQSGYNYGYGYGDQPQKPPINFGGEDPQRLAAKQSAQSAQTLSIVALIVSIICCQLAGLVMAIISMNKAAGARNVLGDIPETKTARVLSIITIILSVIGILATLAYAIVVFAVGGATLDYYLNNIGSFY